MVYKKIFFLIVFCFTSSIFIGQSIVNTEKLFNKNKEGLQVSSELNGTSITFAGRINTDEGIIVGQNGNYAANHVERYTFANENYYLFYMIKMIAPSNGVTIARNTRTSGDINTQNEFEWG